MPEIVLGLVALLPNVNLKRLKLVMSLVIVTFKLLSMEMMLLLAGVALGLQFVKVFIKPLVVPLQVLVVCP
ncbi:hypothetical protein D3C84_550210 [compost metagenome]